MEDEDYFQSCCASIRQNRTWTADKLAGLGFTVLPSQANFIFAKSDKLSGENLYQGLKKHGVLVRWWADSGRIQDYVRITIGSMEQMERLANEIARLLEGL